MTLFTYSLHMGPSKTPQKSQGAQIAIIDHTEQCGDSEAIPSRGSNQLDLKNSFKKYCWAYPQCKAKKIHLHP